MLGIPFGVVFTPIRTGDDNGKPVFPAQPAAGASNLPIAFAVGDIFLMLGKIHGTENQMVMHMAFVDMGRQHIFILAAEDAVSKLLPDLMGFLRCDFPRFKGLYQVVCTNFCSKIKGIGMLGMSGLNKDFYKTPEVS